MSKIKTTKKNTALSRKHETDNINNRLFYKEHGFIKNVALTYLNNETILKYIHKNHLDEFKKFYDKNKKETINHMLFKTGLIDSDYLITELSIKEAVTKNEEEGYKYLESESVFEVAKVLIKNNELELISGNCNPKINTTIYDTDKLSLPFQMPKGGISCYAHSFMFNYTIDCAKNQETKNELREIRDKRIKDLFFNLELENTRWIYDFLNIYNKHEIILRRNGIKGNNLLKKIDDFDFMRKNFSEDLKELDNSLYKTQFEQQGKILDFISKEPKLYQELIKKISVEALCINTKK